MTRPWILCVSVSILCGIIAGYVRPIGPIADLLTVAWGGAALAGLYLFTRERRERRYDLDELRRIHDMAEFEAMEKPEDGEYDSVHCLYCGTVYPHDVPACPQCHRSQY